MCHSHNSAVVANLRVLWTSAQAGSGFDGPNSSVGILHSLSSFVVCHFVEKYYCKRYRSTIYITYFNAFCSVVSVRPCHFVVRQERNYTVDIRLYK